MGVYPRGTAVTVTETFRVLGVPTNPTTVVYELEDPEGTVTVYTFGVDAEVTHPGVGIYLLTTGALDLPGTYLYKIIGGGAVIAQGGGEFTILQSSVAPQDVDYPQFGPCQAWIDCGDIQAACDTEEDDDTLNGIAAMASQIMFEISGRQFTGNCERTVRPCNSYLNPCWGGGFNSWTGWPWTWAYDGLGWGWYDGIGCHCTCESLSRVLLPGYPVTQITEVKIDGIVQSASTYRLDEWRYLTRRRDPLDPGTPLYWPSCQILDLDDTQSGTWSVSYLSGVAPPLAGKAAAAALACELLPGVECKLPTGAVQIVRQGLTINRLQPLAQMLLEGMTGIVAIDAFMAAYNPGKLRRRPSIWSPDGPKFARSVGG